MAPTVSLGNPIRGAASLLHAALQRQPPPVPLGNFVEISSLEVNYMGWAHKPTPMQGVAKGSEGSGAPESRPASGELTRGLREASRTE